MWPRALTDYQRERCLLASKRVRNHLAAVNPSLYTLEKDRRCYLTTGARFLATFAVIHGLAAGHGEPAALR